MDPIDLAILRPRLGSTGSPSPDGTVELLFQVIESMSQHIDQLRAELQTQTQRVDRLTEENKALQANLVRLTEENRTLREQMARNSRNSGKPPSTDGLAKPAPKSLRKKTGRKPGGQPGHQGHRLEPVSQPDQVTVHRAGECERCGGSLAGGVVEKTECRQVFEMPELKLAVTEHRAEHTGCPNCGHVNRAPFPEGVNAAVQYGPRYLAFLVYLKDQHFLPLGRLSQLSADLFGQPVSEGSLLRAERQCHDRLEGFEREVKDRLTAVEVLHADESGGRVKGTLHWFHVLCTETLTLFTVNRKRGREAMTDAGVLPEFKGRLIHDFWQAYLSFDCTHGYCNAHILRELTFQMDENKQIWAKEMIGLLVDMLHYRQGLPAGLVMDDAGLADWLTRYDGIVAKGWSENPLPTEIGSPPRRGRKKRSKAQNLLDRLASHRREVLAFLYDPAVPFTNNQAERDIRMLKVWLKIGGCFRTLQGATVFARIRSYLSTMRKLGHDLLNSIMKAFLGHPVRLPTVALE